MKAITLHQPWASLIVAGEKQYETRSWQPRGLNPGDLLAIHAGKRWDASTQQSWAALQARFPAACAVTAGLDGELSLGVVVGVVRFVRAVHMTTPFIKSQTDQERAVGNWAVGRYAWKLEVVDCFDVPVKASGKQGIWEWDRNPAPPPITLMSRAEKPDIAKADVKDEITPPPPEGWYKWALANFGPLDYHKPEFYAMTLHELKSAQHTFSITPEFTASDKTWLSDINSRLRDYNVPRRGAIIQERRELEIKRETYQKARAAILGAEMTFNRAYREIPASVRAKVDRLRYGTELTYTEIIKPKAAA